MITLSVLMLNFASCEHSSVRYVFFWANPQHIPIKRLNHLKSIGRHLRNKYCCICTIFINYINYNQGKHSCEHNNYYTEVEKRLTGLSGVTVY